MRKKNGLDLHSANDRIYHVDMCSGSGMLGLGLKLALGGRLRAVAHIERDARSAALIVERMEEAYLDSAPLWDDVTTCCEDEFAEYVRQFRPLLVSAGYPCQPASFAGKRLGENDERYLWPNIYEFTRLVRPDYLFLENVPGHLSLGFDGVVRDLQTANYSVSAGLFTAAETGASHERKRLFALAVLGDTEGADAKQSADRVHGRKKRNAPPGDGTPGKSGQKLADACGKGLEGRFGAGSFDQRDGQETHGPTAKLCDVLYAPGPGDFDAWRKLLAEDDTLKPALRRDVDGLASGLDGDRLRIAGNGVSALVSAYAFVILAAAHIARRDDSD